MSPPVISSFLPATPVAIIWIPVIKSPMAIMIPASWAPNKGEARTAIDMIIANIPTPIRKSLDHPECVPLKPSMTLAIPLNRRAIPMNITRTNAVAPGYARARPAKMRTSTPRPMVGQRPFPEWKIPVIIFSIPTNNKIIASIQTNATNVAPGNASA